MELIDKHIINRSTRAIKCLPLNSDFYKDVKVSGLSAEKVLEMKDKYIERPLFQISKSEKIENNFLWLIKIGVLRREVDGQGLTSKVRLTPLGRIILEKNPNIANQKATPFELFSNWVFRKLLNT
ncbi:MULTISPECIES: Npun_F0494 family protein [unclassified Prochlorococcus]|uniref:Npun_F0494 family protein n=1 Tax=unclassified Prochlorococcus TaxID=2627481 RepID=UPI000533A124|nr:MULTISPECIES: Npun_F0494 family protein [unclassified Prochlorococcus]KGG15575.1 hypothetical protein EV06_1449 [Prochlorococcus sp. MIT 0602]KGG17855.1 hypothetical protein EV07_1297 [Prochlorococcus sp. MIT 0603]